MKTTLYQKFIFTFLFLLLTSLTANAQSEPDEAASAPATAGVPKEAREYHLKAAFLRYVAKFVEWPDSVLTAGSMHICVLGQVPYFKGINSINGKVVNDRTLKVIKINSVEDSLKQCQVLFVAETEEENMDKIIKTISGQPVLGFGDIDNFAKLGGDMNFYIMNNRLAIMINPGAVERSQLKISPRMLKLVTVVPPIDQSGVYNNKS